MAYQIKSNNTADLSQYLVVQDLIKKGWVVLFPSSRDTVYDLVIEKITSNGNRVFKTFQIKTLKNNSFKTNNRGSSKGKERTSINGNIRYSYSYADEKIDWMVGVNHETGEIYYYPLSVYKHYDNINVNQVKSKEFEINDGMVNKRKRK